MRGSPSDLELLTDSDVLEALLTGRLVAREQGHRAIADDSIHIGQNWIQYLSLIHI